MFLCYSKWEQVVKSSTNAVCFYVLSVKKCKFLWVGFFECFFLWIFYRIENEADVSTDVKGGLWREWLFHVPTALENYWKGGGNLELCSLRSSELELKGFEIAAVCLKLHVSSRTLLLWDRSVWNYDKSSPCSILLSLYLWLS